MEPIVRDTPAECLVGDCVVAANAVLLGSPPDDVSAVSYQPPIPVAPIIDLAPVRQEDFPLEAWIFEKQEIVPADGGPETVWVRRK